MKNYNVYYKDSVLAKKFQTTPKDGAEINNKATYNPTIECIQGLYQEWYKNGQLNVECIYVDGKKSGLYKEWWPNGLIAKEIYYDNDDIVSYISYPMCGATTYYTCKNEDD